MSEFEKKFFKEFSRVSQRMDSLMREATRGHPLPASTVFSPAADLLELDDAFIVRVDIAGVEPGELSVVLKERVLLIEGRRIAKAGQRARVHQMEIDMGAFKKIIELPGPTEADGIRSKYENGMLCIEIPKPSPRKIQVKME
jgi:HSP20 family protein